MNPLLEYDLRHFSSLLERTSIEAQKVLAEIVTRTVKLARDLGERIHNSSDFQLLAPVRMKVVSFTLAPSNQAQITTILERIREQGKAFLTPANFKETPANRAAFSNWRTTPADLDLIWDSLTRAVKP
jgi:glutamate/tyrosine decarboxylase-like PLP-dependent enzyme